VSVDELQNKRELPTAADPPSAAAVAGRRSTADALISITIFVCFLRLFSRLALLFLSLRKPPRYQSNPALQLLRSVCGSLYPPLEGDALQ
jgi:hypothetical protein